MISLSQLWLPILLAAVLVFAASSLIHMVIKWHAVDFHGFANEEEVRAALRPASPGQYLVPYCSEWKDMEKPEMQQKYREGPIAFLLLRQPGAPGIGQPLALWFLLNVAIAVLAGYLASRTLPAGASFLAVCRVVSITTFLAYACGGLQLAIWMGKPWRSAAMELVDALIYGLLSAVAFAWLWPR